MNEQGPCLVLSYCLFWDLLLGVVRRETGLAWRVHFGRRLLLDEALQAV
jgi:hypothetical protein